MLSCHSGKDSMKCIHRMQDVQQLLENPEKVAEISWAVKPEIVR